jgi:YbbR domain-containing protein
MQWLRRLITHNWFEKIFALLLATMLWVTIASETSSEIGIEVPLEYRNVPPNMEIVGDTTNSVEVRLRGSANLIREITPGNVSTSVDLSKIAPGENVIPLTRQNVQAPTGIEVVRVNPPRVRLDMERTVTKMVTVIPKVQAQPIEGFEVDRILVSPSEVQIQGPESRIARVESVSTEPVNIAGTSGETQVTVDLDVSDPLVRLQVTNARVRVLIRPKTQER